LDRRISSYVSLHHSTTHPNGHRDGFQQLHSKIMQLFSNGSYLIPILRQDGRKLGSTFRFVVDPLAYGQSFSWISLPRLHAVTVVALAPPFSTANANQKRKPCSWETLYLRITPNRLVVSCIPRRYIGNLSFHIVRLSKRGFLLSLTFWG
jgi:hypothetical protein